MTVVNISRDTLDNTNVPAFLCKSDTMNLLNAIWTGLFANLKRLGGGGGMPLLTWLFKSDDDETW